MDLQNVVEQKNKLDIYYQLDEYIKSKERKVNKATLCVYRNVKAHLLAFEAYRGKKITFDTLDFAFYDEFVNYLTFEHCGADTVLDSVGLSRAYFGWKTKTPE